MKTGDSDLGIQIQGFMTGSILNLYITLRLGFGKVYFLALLYFPGASVLMNILSVYRLYFSGPFSKLLLTVYRLRPPRTPHLFWAILFVE